MARHWFSLHALPTHTAVDLIHHTFVWRRPDQRARLPGNRVPSFYEFTELGLLLPPAANGGESHRLEFLLVGQSQAVLHRLVQHLLTLVRAPARAVAVDDVFGGQTKAGGHHSWGMRRRGREGWGTSIPPIKRFPTSCPDATSLKNRVYIEIPFMLTWQREKH